MDTIMEKDFTDTDVNRKKNIPVTEDSPTIIHPLIVPPVLLISTEQHLGTPAEPIVKVDDKVLKGQLIARAKGLVSTNIHASTSGTVVAVAQRSINYDEAKRGTCIVIETDGKDQWTERQPCLDFQQESSTVLMEKIRAAGILDMDGEGLPAHICLNPRKTVNTLIVSACQWNNTFNADDILLLKSAREIVIGLKIIRQILDQPARTVIALEAGKETIAEAIQEAMEKENLIHCEVQLCDENAAGPDRQQLVETVTGQSLDNDGLPSSIGCVCLNAATVYSIYRAVCLGEPAVSQIITVNGGGFKRRQTLSVPLGTPLSFILKQQGFTNDDHYTLRLNNIHTGPVLARKEAPINKLVSSIWSLQSTQDMEAKQHQALDHLPELEFFDTRPASINDIDAPMEEETPNTVDNTQPKTEQEQITDTIPADNADPNLTSRSQNILRLQNKLKNMEDKLEQLNPMDVDAAEVLLLSINVLIEKINAAKSLREEENREAASLNANNHTLRNYINSLQDRLALAQDALTKADDADKTTQSAVKQVLSQLEARLDDALKNLHGTQSLK